MSLLNQPLLNHMSSTRGEIHNKILINSESIKSLTKEDIYNPFQQPASYFKASIHRQSRKIGVQINEEVCPCCNNYINKKQLDLSCIEKELTFLGSGYPLYFKLTKYFAFIVLIQMLISIFFTYFINFVCEEKCVRFFNVPIIDIAHLDTKMNKQAIQNVCIACVLTFLIIYIKPQIFYNIFDYNDRFLNPSKYTIQVKNLPFDTSKQEILTFFEEITGEKVARINLAYTIDDYTEAFDDKVVKLRQMRELQYQLDSNTLDLSEKKSIEEQIEDLKNRLLIRDNQLFQFQQECRNAKTSTFCGTAFVSFELQKPAKDLVQKWGVSTWREAKFLFLNVALSSPYLQYRGYSLIITQAMPPTDIVWPNLGYKKIRSILNNTLLFFGSLGLLVLSFIIQFWVMKYVYPMKKQTYYIANDYYLKFQALLMSIVVLTVNVLLRQLVQRFTQLMKFDSTTQSYSAYINRYIFLYFANSAVLPFLVHGRFDTEDETRELLIQDIHFILLASAFSTPLGKLFDIGFFYKIYERRKLLKYTDYENPYTQHEANQIMEDYTIHIVNSYTFITITLFLSAWYGSVAPFGMVFSVLGLLLNYWVDKYQLLRLQAQPESINEKIIKKVVNILEILPILYLAGNYVFEFRITLSQDLNKFFEDFLGYGLSQIFLSLSFVGFFVFYRKKIPKMAKQEQTYGQMRAFFRTEYDACNPITQQEAHKEWILFLREKKMITKPQKQLLLKQNERISQINAFPLQQNSRISQNIDIRAIQPTCQSPINQINYEIPERSSFLPFAKMFGNTPQKPLISDFKQTYNEYNQQQKQLQQPYDTEAYELVELTDEDLKISNHNNNNFQQQQNQNIQLNDGVNKNNNITFENQEDLDYIYNDQNEYELGQNQQQQKNQNKKNNFKNMEYNVELDTHNMKFNTFEIDDYHEFQFQDSDNSNRNSQNSDAFDFNKKNMNFNNNVNFLKNNSNNLKQLQNKKNKTDENNNNSRKGSSNTTPRDQISLKIKQCLIETQNDHKFQIKNNNNSNSNINHPLSSSSNNSYISSNQQKNKNIIQSSKNNNNNSNSNK